MSTQAGPIPSGRIAEQPEARRGPSLYMWGASVILALIVGGIGGYFLAPTKTVTNTNTVTVPPAAYTASSQVQAQVGFNAATCTYNGPTELKAGTQLSLSYRTTEPEPSALNVFSIAPGTTWEQLIQSTETRAASDPPTFVNRANIFNFPPVGAGGQSSLTTTPLPAGLWAVGCATSADSSNKMFVATILRVVGS